MGSMKKGNLEDGCYWINVKRAWSEQVFSRGFRFNENSTIRELGEAAAGEFTFLLVLCEKEGWREGGGGDEEIRKGTGEESSSSPSFPLSFLRTEDGLFREGHAPLPEGYTYDVEFKKGKSMFDEEYKDDLVKDHFMMRSTSPTFSLSILLPSLAC